MALDTTIQKIKELKTIAETEVTEHPVETLRGRRGQQIQALEQLRDLRISYRRDLLNTAMFFVVLGSERKTFEQITTQKKIGFFSADPEEFFADLSRRVAPALYAGKESVSNVFDVLGRHLEDKANELDIVGYPQLIFRESYVSTLSNEKDFAKLVRRAVNEQMGSEVVGVQAVNSILDKAIDKGHSSKTTPIVLSTDDVEFALKLSLDLQRLTSRVFLVQAGTLDVGSLNPQEAFLIPEVNAASVKEVLAQINSAIKQ
jgi:hypothetical protein